MGVTKTSFGRLPDGREAALYTLSNRHGASVSVTDYGGILQAIRVPDKNGVLADVTLGCECVEHYILNMGGLGAMIGRYANRIAGGRFELNGAVVQLDKNEGGVNHLHGGKNGFSTKLYGASVSAGEGSDSVSLTCISPDGEEHYPGRLEVTITVSFDDSNALTLLYEAVSDKDTVVNLTNHAYFNLAGHDAGSVLDHTLMIDADAFTVIDARCIPTGELRRVDGTPFDLRAPKRVGDGLALENEDEQLKLGSGYDHNFVLNKRARGVELCAALHDEASGRYMEVLTDMPGVQLYTGNHLSGTMRGKGGRLYQKRDGLCLETQYFPDAVNHPAFPSPILRANVRYSHTTVFRFGVK